MIIKISTLPWKNLGPKNELIRKLFSSYFLEENKLFVNEQIDECDFWFVMEGFSLDESVKVNKAIIFITTEEQSIKKYNLKSLEKFDFVISSRKDLKSLGNKLIFKNYANSWFLEKSFDELEVSEQIDKSQPNKISTITSNLENTELHIRRREVVKMIQNNFPDKFDVYGRGVRFIEKKEDGLIGYQFSLAIENSSFSDYFTEKIIDCFLTDTIPIYFGCPNITDYFSRNSMILINDINNNDEIIEKISECLNHIDLYFKMLPHVKFARQKYLHNYSTCAIISSVIRDLNSKKYNKSRTLNFSKHDRFDIIKTKKVNLLGGLLKHLKS